MSGVDILLVEDDPDFVFLTTATLEAVGHRVTNVSSMHDALAHIERSRDVDVVLLDLGLPDIIGLDGIRAAVDDAALPVVVYTADSRVDVRETAAVLGVSAFLVKGETTAAQLDESVRQAARRLPSGPGRSGLVPFDSPESATRAGLELLAGAGGPDRWALVRNLASSPVVLFRHGPGGELRTGASLTWSPALRHQLTRTTPTALREAHELAVDGDGSTVDVGSSVLVPLDVDGFDHRVLVGWSAHGAALPESADPLLHYVARQIATVQQLELERARLARRADIAGNAAAADVLTGLGNRRAYQTFLRTEEARCRRYGHPAVVFVVDLDDLKTLNDRQGHAAGDRYIRAAATALQAATRDSDPVFRIGGDEFAFVAVECDERRAPELEVRVRELLVAHGVHASVGWAARPPEASLEQAADVADARMYEQKVARRAQRGVDTTAS